MPGHRNAWNVPTGHRNAWNVPTKSRPQGCVQAIYQQLIPNLQFTHCIMHKLHGWSKKVLWQRIWLDLCTKQVVSVRACANQFLLCSSSGALFGMRTVQADSCLNSEQIDTLIICVGGQEGGWGGGSFWAGGPKNEPHRFLTCNITILLK